MIQLFAGINRDVKFNESTDRRRWPKGLESAKWRSIVTQASNTPALVTKCFSVLWRD